MTLHVFVSGDPKPQPRPRAFAFKGKARVFDPGTAEHWKGQIALALKPHLPAEPVVGPVEVTLVFLFGRPKSHYRKDGSTLTKGAPLDHVAKPDVDNLAKAVLDTLSTLRFWCDDSQVEAMFLTKRWAWADEKPGVAMTIEWKRAQA